LAIATSFGKNALADHYGTLATHGAVYTAFPSGTGSAGTEPSGGSPAYARKPLTWSAAVAGVMTATAVFDIPAGTTIIGTGLHTAITAGNYVDGKTDSSVAFVNQDTVTVNYSYTQV
jgi:hypothetical protein